MHACKKDFTLEYLDFYQTRNPKLHSIERADIYTYSAAVENHLIKPTFGLKPPWMLIMILSFTIVLYNNASTLKIHRQHLNESIVINGPGAHYSQNIRARKSDGKSL